MLVSLLERLQAANGTRRSRISSRASKSDAEDLKSMLESHSNDMSLEEMKDLCLAHRKKSKRGPGIAARRGRTVGASIFG